MRPGADGVVDLAPVEFLDRLADLVPPSLVPGRVPATDWGECVQTDDERAILQASLDELTVIDIHGH